MLPLDQCDMHLGQNLARCPRTTLEVGWWLRGFRRASVCVCVCWGGGGSPERGTDTPCAAKHVDNNTRRCVVGRHNRHVPWVRLEFNQNIPNAGIHDCLLMRRRLLNTRNSESMATKQNYRFQSSAWQL